jgi:hypothetical protein
MRREDAEKCRVRRRNSAHTGSRAIAAVSTESEPTRAMRCPHARSSDVNASHRMGTGGWAVLHAAGAAEGGAENVLTEFARRCD